MGGLIPHERNRSDLCDQGKLKRQYLTSIYNPLTLNKRSINIRWLILYETFYREIINYILQFFIGTRRGFQQVVCQYAELNQIYI